MLKYLTESTPSDPVGCATGCAAALILENVASSELYIVPCNIHKINGCPILGVEVCRVVVAERSSAMRFVVFKCLTSNGPSTQRTRWWQSQPCRSLLECWSGARGNLNTTPLAGDMDQRSGLGIGRGSYCTSKNNLQIPLPHSFLTYSNVRLTYREYFTSRRIKEWGKIGPEFWFWREECKTIRKLENFRKFLLLFQIWSIL